MKDNILLNNYTNIIIYNIRQAGHIEDIILFLRLNCTYTFNYKKIFNKVFKLTNSNKELNITETFIKIFDYELKVIFMNEMIKICQSTNFKLSDYEITHQNMLYKNKPFINMKKINDMEYIN